MIRACIVGWCDRPHSAKGYCKTHHTRNRLGIDMDMPIRPRRASACSVEDCARPYNAKGYCAMHYYRAKKYGHPRAGRPPARDPSSGWQWGGWLINECSIQGAHGRVRASFGAAKLYPCIECDKPAMDWAYDGTDPTQLYGARPDGSRGFYSRYPEFYMPMCRKCHKIRDGAIQARELAEYRTIKQETGLSFEEIFAKAKGE